MSESSYILDNAWPEARRRLSALEAVCDPATFRRLEALGVRPGFRCFEPGCGAGSVARWLADRVVPGGHVLAVDLDPRFAVAAGADVPGLEVRRQDVVAEPLPEGAFDLVHVRLLLLHLKEREAVLERLVASLKPGGAILLEESEGFALLESPSLAYRRLFEAAMALGRAAGRSYTWPRTAPPKLTALGLVDVGANVDVPLFQGGSVAADFVRLTAEQTAPALLGAGLITQQDLDAGLACLHDPAEWMFGPAMVAVWGRKPY
jgi:SAM-dependent methyltransferase